jgi:uncharacterized membrane protein (DUF4010 family)
MTNIEPAFLNLAVALGIGLLIGAERERRKGSGPLRSPAGIRTFAITSLAGAISFLVGGETLLAIAAAGIIALIAIAYWRGGEGDPGLTTEIALTATILLGGLAMQRPALAGSVGVILAVLLAAKSRLHQFVGRILTESELNDALIFAAATLVVLPLVPDRPMGPYEALNPRSIWLVVILVMAISATGYIAVRMLGAKFGLPIAGLAAGFISSTATIAAMGGRAAKQNDLIAGAVAGAVLSTLATVIQMAIVLGTTSSPTLYSLAAPLVCAGVAAIVYGAVFTLLALRQTIEPEIQSGHPFSLSTALVFAATLSIVLIACAALRDLFGENGVIVAAAVAGFADTHSAAISVASLVASGKLTTSEALLPILAGLSTNTISKVLLAATSGGRLYAFRVIPGLFLVAFSAWAGGFYGLITW